VLLVKRSLVTMTSWFED